MPGAARTVFSSLSVIAVFCAYMALLWLVARWAEEGHAAGKSLVNNPYVYSLSLAVFCSSWTYYGSVGTAATSGLLFMTVYLGPTLGIIFWWTVLRKLVRLKTAHHITSIADFISVRYEKSASLAALATALALVGNMPYIALQLKAVFTTFTIITHEQGPADAWIGSHVGPIIVVLLVVFTIIFGVRRLDPTERHEGMVMAVAVESLFKLVLFMAAGAFVVFSLYDGPADILERFPHLPPPADPFTPGQWIAYLILSMNAVLFLPRQFHIAVVESQSERHIRQAMWMLPLYLLLINLFVYPIAGAGLLRSYPITQADQFVLTLPLNNGDPWLALLVFLGGFSAATAMVLISAMTMATMLTNHLLLPLVGWVKRLGFLERHLLECRWVAVAGYIVMGWWYEQLVGESLMLVNIGMIAFAAFFQFAPAAIGGIFWRAGNKAGALLGLGAGFLVWGYTMLLPSFVHSGWIHRGFLDEGPWGITWLRPEQLFGLSGLDPVSHNLFWSLVFNLGLYVLGSLWFQPDPEAQSQAEEFVGALGSGAVLGHASQREAYVDLEVKRDKIERLLSRFFAKSKAAVMADRCIRAVGLTGKTRLTIIELAELYKEVEKNLAGGVGAAAAHKALERASLFTSREARELTEVYGEILANLRARPKDLIRKIDFHQEREALISRHAAELEEKVLQMQDQMVMRMEAERALRESEERYRTAIESSSDGVAMIKDGRFIYINKTFAEIFGYPRRRELVGKDLNVIVHPQEKLKVLELSLQRQDGERMPGRYDFKGVRKDGSPIFVAVSATTTTFQGDTVVLAYVRDVTARRQAEDDIRRLSRRLIEGIEDERKRLAADLHDEFGQALTALHFGVEALAGGLGPEQEGQRRACGELIRSIEGLADSIRLISSDLRPDMLDHLGLVPTLDWYVTEFQRRHKEMEVDFTAVGFAFKRRLDPRLEIVLYRIVQEALNNVAKYSQAGRVTVQLINSHPRVILGIRDDGVGFEPAPRPESPKLGGIGHISMRERVSSVGGTIEIRSAPGKGVSIRAEVPMVLEENS